MMTTLVTEKTNKRARGRPREFDKGAALKAALLLFWRQGYEGASIAQLTRAMDINAPSLYAAFGSKEQLYREVLELYMTAYLEPIASALGTPGSAREAVRQMLMAAAGQFSRRGWPRGCLVANGALRCGQESQFAVQTTAAMRRLGQDAIRQRIEQAVANGELPVGTDASGLAAFYASVAQGMSVQAVDGAAREELTRLAELAMAAWPAPAR